MKILAILFMAIGLSPAAGAAMTFVHPGALNFQAELDFVKGKIQMSELPWKEEFDRLEHSKFATPGAHGLHILIPKMMTLIFLATKPSPPMPKRCFGISASMKFMPNVPSGF